MVTKNSTIVTLTGEEQTVQFDRSYPYFWVQNLGDGDVLISMDSGIFDGADGVITVPAGGSCGTMHGSAADKLYLLGKGKVQVMGTGSAFNPFKAARKGGDVGKTVSGSSAYTLENAVDYPIMELKLYGKSTQDGTPTPDASVDIVSVGDSGTVNITSNNGGNISVTAAITSALPLCGIPVTSNGNYTDSTGQQWICDELIYNADGTGKIIKRCLKTKVTSSNIISINESGYGNYFETNIKSIINDINDIIPISNMFYGILWDNRVDSKYINTYRCYLNRIVVFRIPVDDNSKFSTLDSMRNFVDNNDVFIVYPIAEPQKIPLTAAETTQLRQLQTYNGITIILNDGGAEMSVKYCTNGVLSEYVFPVVSGLQKQINDLNAAVLSLGSNV